MGGEGLGEAGRDVTATGRKRCCGCSGPAAMSARLYGRTGVSLQPGLSGTRTHKETKERERERKREREREDDDERKRQQDNNLGQKRTRRNTSCEARAPEVTHNGNIPNRTSAFTAQPLINTRAMETMRAI